MGKSDRQLVLLLAVPCVAYVLEQALFLGGEGRIPTGMAM